MLSPTTRPMASGLWRMSTTAMRWRCSTIPSPPFKRWGSSVSKARFKTVPLQCMGLTRDGTSRQLKSPCCSPRLATDDDDDDRGGTPEPCPLGVNDGTCSYSSCFFNSVVFSTLMKCGQGRARAEGPSHVELLTTSMMTAMPKPSDCNGLTSDRVAPGPPWAPSTSFAATETSAFTP